MRSTSRTVSRLEEGVDFANEYGYPILIKPLFTLRGAGRDEAGDEHELLSKLDLALKLSPLNQAALVRNPAVNRDEGEDVFVGEEAGA